VVQEGQARFRRSFRRLIGAGPAPALSVIATLSIDRLSRYVDLWGASASADGTPYPVPLSFDWTHRKTPPKRGLPLASR
jgi:hypothetical protein